MATIEMVPGRRVLSFREYVSLSKEERKSLRNVEILPPRLGRPGLGGVLVEGMIPVYVARRGRRLPTKRK